MKKGFTHTEIRKINIESILKLLSKEYLSASQIAKKMQISKTAVIKILSEMESFSLVKNMASVDGDKQRYQRTSYAISEKAGVICVIDFGSIYVKIVFATLDGTIIFDQYLDDKEFLDLETLNQIVDIIKKAQKDLLTEDQKLLLSIISAPGQINRIEEEIHNSPKFVKVKDIKIKAFFESKLNMSVTLKNDTNLAIVGEIKRGQYQSIEDGMLIYIDAGIGGSILNKGKVIEGETGFAGEFGLMTTYDRFGNKVYIDSLCSINGIANQIRYRQLIGEVGMIKNDNFKFEDIKNALVNDDEIVTDIVKYTAVKIGEMINNLSNILDFKKFYIGGRIKQFGSIYLNWINGEIKTQNHDIDVSYTKLEDDAMIYGAIDLGQSKAFELISNRIKEK